MMESDEVELKRIHEAPGCTSCLMWLKHCKAECCSLMSFNVGQSYRAHAGKKITFDLKSLDKDMEWYYELHGGRFNRRDNTLSFTLAKFTMDKKEGMLYIHRTCDLLNLDLTCSGHPNNKPEFCKALTKETANHKNFILTENCVFKYQLAIDQLEEEDGHTR